MRRTTLLKVGKRPDVTLRHQASGKEFNAKGYTIVLGCDPVAAQILIRTAEEKHVSGRHAEIQFRSDGSVKLRDLGSRNGTWLNDRSAKDEMPSRVGDRLILGAAATTLVVGKLGG